MLDLALKHEVKLQALFSNVAFEDKYKFHSCCSWRESYEAHKSTWDSHEFVSIKDGQILGYIAYGINRDTGCANGLHIINFSCNKIRFGRDVYAAIDDIFTKFNFSKLNYTVVCGNPIEATYDRLTAKYGGRIVGIQRKEVKLIDGRMYDLKMYELFRFDYLRHMKHGGHPNEQYT